MKRRLLNWRKVVVALVLCIYCASPVSVFAGNEGDAWDQLQTLLENTTADQVKPLADVLGDNISPSQLLDGMRAIEAIQAGDLKNAFENSAGFIIGLFSSTFGGYLTVHKAAREAATAVIENWVQDLYEHPSYKGVVTVLNKTVLDSAKAKKPYIPSYLSGSNLSIQSAMQAKESRMYESWVERPEYAVEELVTGEWASRIRQATGRGNMTERQVFNAFLVKAIQDQKSFVLTTFQRVSMKAGAAEARKTLEQKARTILVKMNPPPRDVTLSMEKAKLMAGDTMALRFSYRVGDGAEHSARLVVKNAAEKVLLKRVNDKARAKTGRVQGKTNLGKVPPNVYGKFKVEMTIANIYGQSKTARAFFEVVRDEAKEKERLAYVKKVATAVQKEENFDLTMDSRYRDIMDRWNQVQEEIRIWKEKDKALYDKITAGNQRMQQKSNQFDARMTALEGTPNYPTREEFDREKNSILAEVAKWNEYKRGVMAPLEREWLPIGQRKFAVIQKIKEFEQKIKARWPHLGRYSGKELIAKMKDWSNHISTLNMGLKTALAKNDLTMAEAVIQQYAGVANTVVGYNR